MDAKTFFQTVALMRKAQKEYFKTKSPQALRYSKEYERIVDTEINRVNNIIKEQQNPRLDL